MLPIGKRERLRSFYPRVLLALAGSRKRDQDLLNSATSVVHGSRARRKSTHPPRLRDVVYTKRDLSRRCTIACAEPKSFHLIVVERRPDLSELADMKDRFDRLSFQQREGCAA